jgi:hypothetical protein
MVVDPDSSVGTNVQTRRRCVAANGDFGHDLVFRETIRLACFKHSSLIAFLRFVSCDLSQGVRSPVGCADPSG